MTTIVVLPLPQIEHPVTKQLHKFWFESPVVSLPQKDDAPAGADTRLYPRDCREGVSSSNSSSSSLQQGVAHLQYTACTGRH